MIHSLVVVLALLGLTWSPLISRATSPSGRIYDTPWSLWLPAGGLVLASWIGGWLGLAVVFVIVRGIVAGHELALWTSIYFALGAGCLTVARAAPQSWIRWALVWGLTGEIILSCWWPGGTFGQPPFLGAAAAAVLPLSPWWLVPVFAVGIGRSHSYLAGLAVAVGLLVAWPAWWRPILMSIALVIVVYGLVAEYKGGESMWARLSAWRAGITDMDLRAWLIGYGPGGWGARMWRYEGVPFHQFTAAHHEPLQWLYEAGLVGMTLLVGWLASVRSVVRGSPRWRAAFASVIVLSCGLQVFHFPTLAPVMVLVLGGALHARGIA